MGLEKGQAQGMQGLVGPGEGCVFHSENSWFKWKALGSSLIVRWVSSLLNGESVAEVKGRHGEGGLGGCGRLLVRDGRLH